MTMSSHEIQAYVLTYLEALDCQILERSPAHVTVKLSPEADKALTNRPYYWGFVERVGVEPETMSFTFVFDPEAYQQMMEAAEAKAKAAQPAPAVPETDSSAPKDTILGRYFGITPSMPQLGPGRILREDVVYGCRRLQQIFAAAREGGAFVNLFEQAAKRQIRATAPAVYEPWLGVCFKIEFACDLKREELHFLGISLRSGEIVENFGSKLSRRDLSPRLAGNMHAQAPKISLADAGAALESHLTRQLSKLDYSWAEKAQERLQMELDVVDAYYEAVLREDMPEVEKSEETEQARAAANRLTVREASNNQTVPSPPEASPVQAVNNRVRGMLEPVASDAELAAEPALTPAEEQADTEQEKTKQAVMDREAMKRQYETRRTEMIWQYEPKVKVTAISSGMFHLR
ncbi:YqhG family protein [Paenibacillus silvae]|uniref:YqhG family protein n=1 Tax=Paenibacillus silvae TaxID=1325358 RepID=UPI00200383F4|nr:YqhG family protein [Paenibacillus silvae]